MTDKDKQTIAKIDLLKIQGLTKRVNNLLEANESLFYSTQGTDIDYSKDHVQTSPKNQLEESLTQICDNDREIKKMLQELNSYKEKLYRIPNAKHTKVLFEIYIEGKSFSDIAKEGQYKYRSNVEYIHKKALVSYYNTIYCGF